MFIYHQNKNIKELEEISYYENYKSDLEDIRNIQYNDTQNSGFLSEHKSLIERYALAIAAFALAGEAPIINPSWLSMFQKAKNLSFWDSLYPYALESFFITAVNVAIYLFIFGLNFVKYRDITRNFYNFLKEKFLPKSKKVDNDIYFHFDPADYDKHEHRSTKLLINEELNDNGKNIEYKPIVIKYNKVQSAYELMQEIKNASITKIVSKNEKSIKKYSYNLFPSILKNVFSDSYKIRENYRIIRIDKVTTKILFRYKITNISLKEFLNLIDSDKNFNNYYEKIVQNSNDPEANTIFYYIKIIENSFDEKEISSDIYLNLYIVYSFILKLHESNLSDYSYTIQKDQFRVHYHINKLPKNNLDKTLDSIANLMHIYFLARFKNFRYLHR